MPRPFEFQDLAADFKLTLHDMASGVTLDANNKIASIANSFGNGDNPATTARAARRHAVVSYNGYPTAFSDSTSYDGILISDTSAFPKGNEDRYMMVINLSQDGIVFGYRGDGANQYCVDNPYPGYRLYSSGNPTLTGTTSPTTNSLHCLELVHQSSVTRMYVDGVLNGTLNAVLATTIKQIGIKGAETDYYTMKGYMALALMGRRAPTQDEQWRIQWKAAQISGRPLPSSNPYSASTPMTSSGPTLSASSAAIVVTARTANVLLGHTLPASAAVLGMVGRSALTVAQRRLVADGLGASIAGAAVSARQSRTLAAPGQQFIIGSATVSARRAQLVGAAGSPAIMSGRNAELLHGFVMPARVGSIVMESLTTSLKTVRRLPLVAGSLIVEGAGVGLDRLGKLTLDTDAAKVNMRGKPAGLTARRQLAAERGGCIFAWGGMTLAARRRTNMVAEIGGVVTSGGPIRLIFDRRMVTATATIRFIGEPAGTRVFRRHPVAAGSFVLTTADTSLRAVGRFWQPLSSDRVTNVRVKYRLATIVGRQRVAHIRRGRMDDIAWPSKPVGERARYRVNWTDELSGGDTIVSSTLVKLSGTVEISDQGHDDTQVFCWLEGGTPRSVSRFSSTIVKASGARLVATIAIRCD